MRLLIIRHGDPEYVNDTLTAEGHKQATAVARRLSSGIEGEITHLYTSPMGRAQLTAAATEKALDKKASVEEWTRELSYWPRLSSSDDRPGEGGLAMWDVSAEVVRSRDDVTANSQWAGIPAIAPAAEFYDVLQRQSDSFVARHGYAREGCRYRMLRRNTDVIAVFCHGGFGLSWIAHLLNLPLAMVWSSFFLPTSSVTTVLFDQRSADFAYPRAIGVGDIGHLYKENLLPLPDSKYERPNTYGSFKRPSGIKANFW